MKEDVLIENVRYVIEKNPKHNDRLSPVLEYLENIMKVKADGSSGHYPKCIKDSMTSDEYSKLRNADSESFEKIVCVDYGGYIPDVPMCDSRWSIYGNPYSVDDKRIGSHTYLFI